MLFRSPPPSLSITAPLSDAVASLSAAVDREARFAWEADEASLQLTEDGRLAGGEEYEPSYLEASGFRALVTRYNESFPRAHSLLASLTPPTVAAVWREAFRPSDGRVLVCERHPGEGQVSAVCAIYPPGWPVEYTVAHVARAALEALPERTPCRLQYDAANATLALTVMMPDFDVAISASDMYGEPAPAVHVIGKDGRNFGTPHIGPTRRRRPGTGGASTHDGLVNSIRAAHTVLR